MKKKRKTKICGSCKIRKSIKKFNKDRSNKDGLGHSCRRCTNSKRRERRAIRNKLFPPNPVGCPRTRTDEQIKEYNRERSKLNTILNREEINRKRRVDYKKNIKEQRKRCRDYYHKNLKIAKLSRSTYRKNNRNRIDGLNAKRRALLKNAIPKNQTKQEKLEIIKFYKNRPKGKVVDHIVPITPRKGNPKGKHELKNLQYLTFSENSKKHNIFPYYTISFYKKRGLL